MASKRPKSPADRLVSPSKHLITTRPKPVVCACGCLVIQGYAEGRKIQVDPTPLSPSQQAMAILLGTRMATSGPDGLVEITDWRYELSGPRFPNHRCGVKWRAEVGALPDPRFTIAPPTDTPPY